MSEAFAAYLMAYFLDEGRRDGEQIRFAVSRGSTPTSWLILNQGASVLTSSLGEQAVRDPFLVRDSARGVYVVIATDLRTWPDGDWSRAVRWGSRSIIVWESADLVSFSPPRRVEIAPPNAGNAWAPKAFWSAERGCWLVFWASSLHVDPGRREPEYQRMLVAPTTDFRTFGAPEIYLDLGHDVIDASFLEKDGTWYRFAADAHAPQGSGAETHHVSMERGTSLEDPAFVPAVMNIGSDVIERGEGPAVVAGLDGESWYLLIDEFGLRGYQLFESGDLASGRWTWVRDAELPLGARHGSLLPITEAERQRLLAADGSGTTVKASDE